MLAARHVLARAVSRHVSPSRSGVLRGAAVAVRAQSSSAWQYLDAFELGEQLTESQLAVAASAHDWSQSYLQPRVIEAARSENENVHEVCCLVLTFFFFLR